MAKVIKTIKTTAALWAIVTAFAATACPSPSESPPRLTPTKTSPREPTRTVPAHPVTAIPTVGTGLAPAVETQPAKSLVEGGEILPGLPGSSVETFAFDNDNVLWIGISGGWARFDGIAAYYNSTFRVFDMYNTRIPHTDITRILVDATNKKWFGNVWGNVFTFDNRRWETLPVPEKPGRIIGMAEDREGRVWVLGKSGFLWNYKDAKVDKVLPVRSPVTVVVDSKGDVWVGGAGGLFRVAGDVLDPWNDKTPGPFIAAMSGDRTGNLYVATRSGYVEDTSGGRTYAEGGRFALRTGRFELIASEKTGMPGLNVSAMTADSKGNLWLGYWNQSVRVAKFDGQRWATFGPGTPIQWSQVEKIVDANGLIWVGGNVPDNEQSPLVTFDGNSWAVPFAVLQRDPRMFWREKDLVELYNYPLASADIHEALIDPASYRGQKIRIIGRIESGFEYANFVDAQGNRLNIWPETHVQLSQFMKENAIDAVPTKSENAEFIGYLEFGARYGHMGSWLRQLFITEVYPYVSDRQKNDSYRELFKTYIAALAQDKENIRAVIARWVSAMKSGNIEEMKEVYYPESVRYKSLSDEAAQEYARKNPMDTTINSVFILVQGARARVRILDATVQPARYFTPTGNVRVKGDGLYKLRSMDFVKHEGEWKISAFDYSPEYERPSITPPPPAPPRDPKPAPVSPPAPKQAAPR